MRISTLNEAECKTILIKIVSEFGDGQIEAGRYVFDAINRLPPDYAERRLTTSQFVARSERLVELLVIFDPHPNNNGSRLNLLHSVGIDDNAYGIKLAQCDITRFLADTNCDFYVTAPDGKLLAVASHEDGSEDNERMVWCPIPIE